MRGEQAPRDLPGGVSQASTTRSVARAARNTGKCITRRTVSATSITPGAESERWLVNAAPAYLIEFFRNHPSVDCAESDPVVLGFDHFSDKPFNIGSGLPYRNWQSILEEIAKCEVTCANCHRRRTARRGVHVRALLCAVIPSESGCRDSNPN